jgi:hypothetical protein
MIGCTPYDNRVGEYNAGPVDSSGFPAAYLGANSRPNQAGSGVFIESVAYINGVKSGYFSFPLAAAQTAKGPPLPPNGCPTAGADPLRLVDSGKPYAAAPTPNAYRFTDSCTPAAGYRYDQLRDALHYDQQGNVFVALPSPTYIPIVLEHTVSASAIDCQSIKSEKLLLAHFHSATATGRYLFWAVIDTGAAVYRFNDPNAHSPQQLGGVGIQSYGWYQQYYLAYLDGGEVPTEVVTIMQDAGGPPPCVPATKTVTRVKTQKLYVPTQLMIVGYAMPQPVKVGDGYDVLEAGPGDPGYSPVCAVFTYVATDSKGAAITLDALPTSAKDVVTRYGGTLKPAATPYFYCPQVK